MTERRFPPQAMTANTTDLSSASYGKGTYVASASSEASGSNTSGGTQTKAYAYKAFDRVIANGKIGWEANHWHSSQLGNEQWIRLDMPVSVRVTKYVLHSRDQDDYAGTDFPNQFVLEGSNDGSSWSQLNWQNGQASSISSAFTRKEYFVSTSSYYSKLRLRVMSVGPNGLGRNDAASSDSDDSEDESDDDAEPTQYVVLPEIELYGVIESDDDDGDGFPWLWVGLGVGAFFLFFLLMMMMMMMSG